MQNFPNIFFLIFFLSSKEMGKVKKEQQEPVEDQSDDGWADSDNDETLLKEILTFGGNKDDLDLIKANALPDPNLDEEAVENINSFIFMLFLVD